MEIRKMPVSPIGANCYIVSEADEAFIIDPGGDAEKIIREVGNRKVRYILLTHSHFDHISGLNDIAKAFPDAKTAINIYEHDWLYSPQLNLSEDFGLTFVFTGKVDLKLENGMQLDFAGTKINLIHTPGHTPGSTCFYIEKSDICENNLLFSGDTLFRSSIGRTDFPGGDGRKIIDSIKIKLLVLPDETVVYPGHDENTSIAMEKKFNPFLKRI
ncbi:MBL fold metallo-hydrolase [bacterium]|nr:MBL fold metallo-hydrolase [bacterium]MBP5591559.1 MBL fold metallo-hydrolase [bacterium]